MVLCEALTEAPKPSLSFRPVASIRTADSQVAFGVRNFARDLDRNARRDVGFALGKLEALKPLNETWV